MYTRFLAFFLALTLLAGPALAAEQSFAGLFSIEYDEAAYHADTVTYLTGSDGDSRWLMMLGANDYLIDVSMYRVEGWEHLSLTDPGDPMTSWYLKESLGNGIEYIGNISAGGALFCLFRTFDADGEYLMAETVRNGWAISFYAYYDDPEQKTDERLTEALTELVSTYQPE